MSEQSDITVPNVSASATSVHVLYLQNYMSIYIYMGGGYVIVMGFLNIKPILNILAITVMFVIVLQPTFAAVIQTRK